MFTDDEDAAKAISNGLCDPQGLRPFPSIPVFTPDEYKRFEEWAQSCHAVDSVWKTWIDALFREYKAFTPKRLADQIGGNVDSFSFNANAFVIQELSRRKMIDKPVKGKVFTKNLLMIR